MNYNMMFTRSASDLAIKLLYILAVNQRMMNIDTLALWANRDDVEKVRKECNVLAEMGYLQIVTKEKNEKFYQLADSAQGMLPGFAQILPAPVENSVHGKPATETPMIIDAAENGQKTAENGVLEAENGSVHGKPATGDSRLESLESSSLKDLKNLDSLDSAADAEFPETTPEILCKNTHRILNGKDVRCDDVIKSREVREVLAWIAQAYQSRNDLNSPVGLVYRGLRRELKNRGKIAPDMRPEGQYVENPFKFLPLDYLDAVGLGKHFVQRCEKCGEADGVHLPTCPAGWSRYSEHVVEERVVLAEADEPDAGLQALDKNHKAALAWESVLSNLQAAMPRASFETWVRDTLPCAWEDQAGELVVISRNQYAIDWLTSHVLGEMQRMLAEILGRVVAVRFVIGNVPGGDE